MRPKTFWLAPPTSCPFQKLILDSKMNKTGCSLKYGCFIYCWKTHGKEISRSPNKFWPAPPKNQSWILHQVILEKLFNTWVTQQICLNRPANLCKLPWLQAYTSLWSEILIKLHHNSISITLSCLGFPGNSPNISKQSFQKNIRTAIIIVMILIKVKILFLHASYIFAYPKI